LRHKKVLATYKIANAAKKSTERAHQKAHREVDVGDQCMYRCEEEFGDRTSCQTPENIKVIPLDMLPTETQDHLQIL